MKVSRNRLLATALILIASLSMLGFYSLLPAESAYAGSGSDYAFLEGVLHDDTYILYPYEQKSVDIGFSKYGEIVNPDEPVGLAYDGQDCFAKEEVGELQWINGWVLNCTYTMLGKEYNIWAYALFSDIFGKEGGWVQNSTGAMNAPYGGRKTSGMAVTEPIKVLYDGPRRLVALLNTTIYDPRHRDPFDMTKPMPLLRIYIQVVFNKVKKYVLLIKDIKLIDPTKLVEKAQIKFGERGEWDLGDRPQPARPWSYAHFFHGLETKYDKNPWYYDEYAMDVNFDLCQIIDWEEEYVGFAAFWPDLMSYRVAALSRLTREEVLTDLSNWDHHWTGDGDTKEFLTAIPEYYEGPLYYPDCKFGPPDWEWSYGNYTVYVDDEEMTEGIDYNMVEAPYFGSPPGHGSEGTKGKFWIGFTVAPSDGADIRVHWKLKAAQDDIFVEPRTPFVFGEWVFDLSHYEPEWPTEQFRAVSVYGVTDLNDGEDADMTSPWTEGENIIDKEVAYQLDEVFNPWDLRQAVGSWSWDGFSRYEEDAKIEGWDLPGKFTERWVEFFEGDGDTTDFWLPEQIIVPPYCWRDWDQYCSFRERVLVDGELQTPYDVDEDDYDYELVTTCHAIQEELLDGPHEIDEGDIFWLTYPRLVPGTEHVWIENADIIDLIWDSDYAIDYTHGKLVLLRDLPKLKSDEVLKIEYDCYYPGAKIEFTDDSKPPEGAEVKVLYSTLRIVWKVDKYIAWTDGVIMEVPDSDDWDKLPWDGPLGPDFGMRLPGMYFALFLRHRPVMPEYWNMFLHENLYYEWPWEWVEIIINEEPYEGPWEIIEELGIIIFPPDIFAQFPPGSNIKIVYPLIAGRYEWNIVGTDTAPVDITAASMVSEGLREWKNFDVKLSGLDYNETMYGPRTPFIFRNMSGTGEDREDYYDDQMAQSIEADAGRAHLKDDWCTTLPIASSNIITVGGPYSNIATEYFNDFTDVYYNRIGEYLGNGFYSHACWNRNLYQNTEDIGHAIISTYKDINGTTGLIIYGTTGEDGYYAAYALQHGLFDIMQWLQPGVTSIVLEFNYTVHPSDDCFFHVVECLGTITECGGFDYLMGILGEPDTAEYVLEIFKNSYSSEYLDFRLHIDLDSVRIADIVAIEIIRPNYIYIHWEPGIHPDP